MENINKICFVIMLISSIPQILRGDYFYIVNDFKMDLIQYS